MLGWQSRASSGFFLQGSGLKASRGQRVQAVSVRVPNLAPVASYGFAEHDTPVLVFLGVGQ
ncbi:hypothetical protein IMCC9480_264 [Oxalobacteraceae bacterium IMCC9480]|nr:hypothetical protein IMCC9480_264 [Oxalobacteraceae bacterium IMCC9480]